MRITTLRSQQDRLNDLVGRTETQPDILIKATLTEFICVRTSGFLEQAVQEIYGDFAQKRSRPPVASFVSRRLARIQNIRADTLRALVREFDSAWADALDEFMAGERSEALNSVISNRNRIAHGQPVSLGLVQMRHWLARVFEVVEFLEDQCS